MDEIAVDPANQLRHPNDFYRQYRSLPQKRDSETFTEAELAIDPLVTEHIQPVSRGGKTARGNLALA